MDWNELTEEQQNSFFLAEVACDDEEWQRVANTWREMTEQEQQQFLGPTN